MSIQFKIEEPSPDQVPQTDPVTNHWWLTVMVWGAWFCALIPIIELITRNHR